VVGPERLERSTYGLRVQGTVRVPTAKPMTRNVFSARPLPATVPAEPSTELRWSVWVRWEEK